MRLMEQVTLQAPTVDADGVQDGWAAGFDTAAGYKRLRGGEEVIGRRLAGTQVTVIRLRATDPRIAGIGPGWRATDARTNEVFNIRSVIHSENRLWVDLTAESGVRV